MLLAGPIVTGWLLLGEFIFTLAMALRCYPLQPGGLLAIQAVLIGLTTPESVYEEVTRRFPVILLLIFMVAGIYFLRDLLLFVFTRLILRVRSRESLALLFCGVAALLSAFLDALTVVAVAVTVGMGFYEVYHRVASGKTHATPHHDATHDADVQVLHRDNLEAVPRVPARADDARGGRHGDRRRDDAGRRAAEPADRRAGGLELRPVLPAMAPVSVPVAVAGLRHLLAGRAVPAVRLRRAAAGRRSRGAARTTRVNSRRGRRRATGRC